MLISEFDALYADRLRREHPPEHFPPRNDIYAERRPDPREVELAAAILDRIPPQWPAQPPRTAAVTPAGAESVVSVGLIGGALITDLGPAGLLYSWAYGNFLLTPETGRYWQEQAGGAEGPLGGGRSRRPPPDPTVPWSPTSSTASCTGTPPTRASAPRPAGPGAAMCRQPTRWRGCVRTGPPDPK